jgi:hypothetical protein
MAFGGARSVQCTGNADYCVATVRMPANGASDQRYNIRLTGTNFRRVGLRVIPNQSRGAFAITGARFTTGGSISTFLVDAVRGQPRNARIILYFGAGVAPGTP